MTERLYTIHQVARMLGADTREVAQWMQKSWLPFRRLPEGTLRISETNLIEFLKGQGIDIRDVLGPNAPQTGDLVDTPAPTTPERPSERPMAPARPELVAQAGIGNRESGSRNPEVGIGSRESGSWKSEAGSRNLESGVQGRATTVTPSEAAAPVLAIEAKDTIEDLEAAELRAEDELAELKNESRVTEESPAPAGEIQAARVGSETSGQTAPTPGDAAAQLAQAIFREALARNAEEIHLDADGSGLNLRMRIDGVLQGRGALQGRLDAAVAPQLLAHLKFLAGVDVSSRGLQRGRFSSLLDGSAQEFELIACPVRHGERLTLHVLDSQRGLMSLADLGLESADERRLRGLLRTAGAMILLVGPPRSGKSTTLRAMVADRADPSRLVALLEAGPSAFVPDVAQATVDAAAGFGMASAVQAFAAQDADMIAACDVPDAATCAELLRSAQAGATVLAALNAPDCVAGLGRLWEVGLERWATAASLSAIITQRTLRRLCPECRRPVVAAEIPPRWEAMLEGRGPIFTALGCERCGKSGYSGRTGVFSILHVDSALGAMIRHGADAQALADAATSFESLVQAGLKKVLAGETSLEELDRVLPMA